MCDLAWYPDPFDEQPRTNEPVFLAKVHKEGSWLFQEFNGAVQLFILSGARIFNKFRAVLLFGENIVPYPYFYIEYTSIG